MGRHSKNNNDRAFFTYHERQAARKGYASSAFYKHANTSYGGGELKVGSDSLRDFDACCLSLHPCRDPVITPQGYLYEREVIYEYILQKRKDNERALQAWAAQEAADVASAEEARREDEQRAIEAFERGQKGLASAGVGGVAGSRALTNCRPAGATSSVRGHVVNDDVSKHAADLNFWTPQNAPMAAKRVAKPDTTIRCPMSGEPLRLKQLISVKFTPADSDGDPSATLEALKPNERYVCPITHKALATGAELVVLRTSGTVVTRDSVNKVIKKDMLDPFCEPPAKLKEKDLIAIRTEGTGFAQRGNTEVKKKGAMPTY
mmetsp:Transcript_5644/g.14419  ORF Transcript_5644/g.14419 Transcript_5644/m.14419 type:complete len:319 (-) Transcript_5644:74-1030(-)